VATDRDAARSPQRPIRLGGESPAVRAPKHVPVPDGRAARSHEPCLRKGVRRGEAEGLADGQHPDEQAALAAFYTVNPVELFNRTFQTIAEDRGLTLVEEARLFVMLNMAGADGLINCWDDKAKWSFWRPVTAIQLGDTDDNPATVADKTWTSLIAAPQYPEHPSGYNCVTSSFMNAGRAFFGTNKIAFGVYNTATQVTRNYTRFTDVVKDTIDARVYQGIHFRAGDVQGAWIGRKVARWLDKHYFQAVDDDDNDDDADDDDDD
jgi:hypothetical protein